MNKPVYIEFSGMPKSGKTTISDIIAHSLKRNDFIVKEFHGGGRYAPISKKHLVNLNIWLANSVAQYIVETDCIMYDSPIIHILDRGIFDRCVFTKALYKMKLIEIDDYNRIVNYLTMPLLTSKIDCVFLFITSPQLSIEREYHNKIIEKAGRVMNPDFLTLLKDSSLESSEELKDRFRLVRIIDTENNNNKVKETALNIFNEIIDIARHDRS